MEQNFFQNETKFIVGETYETIRVKSPPYNSQTWVFNPETCDEIGTIIPNSELLLGKYISSQRYGFGDNSGRCDNFINENGDTISNYLDYDGTTRYRLVKTHMEERINYIKLVNGIEENGNDIKLDREKEHIHKFMFNEGIVKEVCSFMNPLIN